MGYTDTEVLEGLNQENSHIQFLYKKFKAEIKAMCSYAIAPSSCRSSSLNSSGLATLRES
jgi:hypothetical protein